MRTAEEEFTGRRGTMDNHATLGRMMSVGHRTGLFEALKAAGPVTSQELADRAGLNERLWVIEDDIRLKEKAQAFDDEFIRLARSVYLENDTRARIKKEINLALGSSYVEEKSYQDYRSGSAS